MSFQLKKKVPEEPYFEVIIKADSNDADYISETTEFSVLEWEKYGEAALRIILEKLSGNGVLEEKDTRLTSEESDMVDHIDFPYADWGICHTICETKALYHDTEGYTYEVILD